MKLGRLLRGLSAASLAALVSVPLAPTAASAAPAAPASYAVLARAYPLYWAGSGSLPVADLRVPYVSASTNHLPVARSQAALTHPDLNVATLRGEQISGLHCEGFDERQCVDPFVADADLRPSGHDSVHQVRVASFTGREGRFPGRIRASASCPGDCGHQLLGTAGDAAAPAGGVPGYISVGSSVASQDISIDDRGRLVGMARSELRDVVIGPHGEVRFSSLVTSAQASGTGAPDSKNGKADIKVTDFVILDNPVVLTRGGLRLASGAPSEQEAYDGAKALLAELAGKGIKLELPDFGAQVVQKAEHVTVQVAGLRVRFDRSVQGPGVTAQTVDQIIDLGSSTALVAAFDTERNIDVAFDGNQPVVQPGPPASEAAPAGSPETPGTTAVASPGSTSSTRPPAGRLPPTRKAPRVKSGPPVTVAPDPPAETPAVPTTEVVAAPELAPAPPEEPTSDDSATVEEAITAREVAEKLGLRDARSVSSAFGAFLGLGLILPVARFVIRRLG